MLQNRASLMAGFTLRELIIAAAIVCVLVAWFVDCQVLHEALRTASAIISSAREP